MKWHITEELNDAIERASASDLRAAANRIEVSGRRSLRALPVTKAIADYLRDAAVAKES